MSTNDADQIVAERWEQPPPGVRLYSSSHEFVAEDASRHNSSFGAEGDLRGWDIGYFRLSQPEYGPQAFSEWTVSVHSREVYAVLRRWPNQNTYTFDGPVWLIDTVPELLDASAYGRPLSYLTGQVERHHDETDSLLLATEWIRAGLGMVREMNVFELRDRATALIDSGNV